MEDTFFFLSAWRLALVCVVGPQCFISLSLVWEEIALQMRLIHFPRTASGQRSRGGLPEWRPQYFHVLICPPRVWRYKSLSSSSAQGAGKRGSPEISAVFYSASGGKCRAFDFFFSLRQGQDVFGGQD